MNHNRYGLTNFITCMIIAALFLIGTVPSYAVPETGTDAAQPSLQETTQAQDQTGTQDASSAAEAADPSDPAEGSSEDPSASAEETKASSSATEETTTAPKESAARAATVSADGVVPTVVPATPKTKGVPKLNSRSAILIDADTGTVLYEKNADKVREPASVTKILNCLVVLETLDLQEKFTSPEVDLTGSIIGVMKGETLTIEQLVYGMMLESGNDAAEALAIAAGGSVKNFCDMMNDRAKECGAEHTDFKNPNGLNEDPKKLNWTTARDLALITKEAMKNETFAKVVSTSRYTIPATEFTPERKLANSNLCLWDKETTVKLHGKDVPMKYDGCIGVKTGLTTTAGYCFVGCVERDGARYITVTMHADDELTRFQDSMKLWDYAFDTFEERTVIHEGDIMGTQRVRRGALRKVRVGAKDDLKLIVRKDDPEIADGVTTELVFDEDRVTAPVEKGEIVGKMYAKNASGQRIAVQDLCAMGDVEEGGPLSYIGVADEDAPMVIGFAAGVVLLLIIIAIVRSRKKKVTVETDQEDMKSQLVKMRTAGVGMTPAEWSELTGDPVEVPMSQGPKRLTAEEMAELNAPEVTRLEKKARTKSDLEELRQKPVDVNEPRRHGRLSQEELDDLLAGKMVGESTSADRSRRKQ